MSRSLLAVLAVLTLAGCSAGGAAVTGASSVTGSTVHANPVASLAPNAGGLISQDAASLISQDAASAAAPKAASGLISQDAGSLTNNNAKNTLISQDSGTITNQDHVKTGSTGWTSANPTFDDEPAASPTATPKPKVF